MRTSGEGHRRIWALGLWSVWSQAELLTLSCIYCYIYQKVCMCPFGDMHEFLVVSFLYSLAKIIYQ